MVTAERAFISEQLAAARAGDARLESGDDRAVKLAPAAWKNEKDADTYHTRLKQNPTKCFRCRLRPRAARGPWELMVRCCVKRTNRRIVEPYILSLDAGDSTETYGRSRKLQGGRDSTTETAPKSALGRTGFRPLALPIVLDSAKQ